MTMSLEARNLAYFNVAHVGADFARQKTESWAAASKTIREQRSKHLNLAYGRRASEQSGTCIPPPTRKLRASFTSTEATGSAAARRYLPASPRGHWQTAGRQRFAGLHDCPRGEPDADHERTSDRRSTGSTQRPPSTVLPGPIIVTGWSAGGPAFQTTTMTPLCRPTISSRRSTACSPKPGPRSNTR